MSNITVQEVKTVSGFQKCFLVRGIGKRAIHVDTEDVWNYCIYDESSKLENVIINAAKVANFYKQKRIGVLFCSKFNDFGAVVFINFQNYTERKHPTHLVKDIKPYKLLPQQCFHCFINHHQ